MISSIVLIGDGLMESALVVLRTFFWIGSLAIHR